MALAACVLVACGPGDRSSNGVVDAPPTPPEDTPATVDMSRVFAHSGAMLYRLDAATLDALPIGPMTGLGTQSLTDLAIDKDDGMVGVTLERLYAIDSTTGTATLIRDLSMAVRGLTSLSYVPDPADDTKDILVSAASNGDVFQIDVSTGNATKIGSFGTFNGDRVVSSGDLIGVRGFGIYATVDVGDRGSDYLARIDPTDGWKATPIGAGTSHDHIFGLGFWGGKIYGFVDKGSGKGTVVELSPATGASTDLVAGSVRWYGAGVATDAPIIY